MARSEGDQLLTGAFHATMEKIAKKWNGNESSFINNTFSKRLQL